MADLTCRIVIDFQCEETGTGLGSVPEYKARIRKTWDLTEGTGANQADRLWAAYSSITQPGSSTVDLFNAAGIIWPIPDTAGNWGDGADFAEGVAIFVVNKALDTTVNDVDVKWGGDASAWASYLGSADVEIGPITPDGFMLIINPDATGLGTITATSADVVKLENDGGAGTVSDIQWGVIARSA